MQAPQSLEELESAIQSALAKVGSAVEFSGWIDAHLVREAADELMVAIREAHKTGVPLTPCQKLTGDWLLQMLQRVHDTCWRS